MNKVELYGFTIFGFISSGLGAFLIVEGDAIAGGGLLTVGLIALILAAVGGRDTPW